MLTYLDFYRLVKAGGKFDIYRVPGKYIILCDWYMGNECVAMFDDTNYGYTDAQVWIREQQGVDHDASI